MKDELRRTVVAAKAEYNSWPEEKKASVRLEGTDRYYDKTRTDVQVPVFNGADYALYYQHKLLVAASTLGSDRRKLAERIWESVSGVDLTFQTLQDREPKFEGRAVCHIGSYSTTRNDQRPMYVIGNYYLGKWTEAQTSYTIHPVIWSPIIVEPMSKIYMCGFGLINNLKYERFLPKVNYE